MKRYLMLIFTLFILVGCDQSVADIEQAQQKSSISDIVRNQPVPNLGGFSVERYILTKIIEKRNENVMTYSYIFTKDGKIIEICEHGSYGFGVPYATQISNPVKVEHYSGGPAVIANSEPNSLYPPSDTSATFVNCFNEDGSFSPQTIEDNVNTFTFRIKADIVLHKIDGNDNAMEDLENAKKNPDSSKITDKSESEIVVK